MDSLLSSSITARFVQRYNHPPVHIAWNETTVSTLDWIVEWDRTTMLLNWESDRFALLSFISFALLLCWFFTIASDSEYLFKWKSLSQLSCMAEYDVSQHMLAMLTISVYFHEDTRSIDKEIRLCLLVTPSSLEYQKDLFSEKMYDMMIQKRHPHSVMARRAACVLATIHWTGK